MEVAPKLKVVETLPSDTELGSLMLFDCTLPFSDPGNKTGWGAPNIETSNIIKTEYIITDPNGSTTTVEDTALVLPNTVELGFKITADQLGLTKIISGIYRIEYKLTDDANPANIICTVGFYLMKQDVLCCLDKRVVLIDPSVPMSEEDRHVIDLRGFLCTASENALLGQADTARKIMEFLATQDECNCP